jgi:hypothetical protein
VHEEKDKSNTGKLEPGGWFWVIQEPGQEKFLGDLGVGVFA